LTEFQLQRDRSLFYLSQPARFRRSQMNLVLSCAISGIVYPEFLVREGNEFHNSFVINQGPSDVVDLSFSVGKRRVG